MQMVREDVMATGGCQCGAVRYRICLQTAFNHVCHCRMCQRATGGLFAALAGGVKTDFWWTKGAPGHYASSNMAIRSFCSRCGTPLGFTYEHDDARQYVTVGSLDEPELGRVFQQYGLESKLSFVEFCEALPQERTSAPPELVDDFATMIPHQKMEKADDEF